MREATTKNTEKKKKKIYQRRNNEIWHFKNKNSQKPESIQK